MKKLCAQYCGLLTFAILLMSCGPPEEKYPPIDEEFCADIHLVAEPRLSEELARIPELKSGKTGVYVLEEGDISMIARAWLTEAAEKTIDIQYFIFSADNIGLIAADYLLRAADRGVQVRILVDDIMVEADADDLLTLDAHPNFSIKVYNPNANIGKNIPQKIKSLVSDFRGFNQRMHNKTFIVDGKVVITGGRNIADEYFDYDHEYNFRDRDVLLLGGTVSDIAASFSDFWQSELSVSVSEAVDSEEYNLNIDVKYNYLHQYACNPLNFWPQIRENIRNIPQTFREISQTDKFLWIQDVRFISDEPGKNDGSAGLKGGGLSTDSLVALVNSAKESILIQSPYLVTTELGQELFLSAVQRGVDVKILTNSLSSTDNLEAFNGYKRDRDRLIDMGVQIYEWRPDAEIRREVMTGALQVELDFMPIFGLHAKSMVIDKYTSVIGTFNLDPRSANLNTECIVIIRDSTIANDLYETMRKDMLPENAWKVTSEFNPDSDAGWAKQFKLWTRGFIPKDIL